jgi:hypothetical protein
MSSHIIRLAFSALILLASFTLHARGKKHAEQPDLQKLLLTTSSPADLEVCFKGFVLKPKSARTVKK